MESMEDCYQVMKFCGDEIDNLEMTYENEVNYWDLNNFWWSAATIYVPKKNLQNTFSAN